MSDKDTQVAIRLKGDLDEAHKAIHSYLDQLVSPNLGPDMQKRLGWQWYAAHEWLNRLQPASDGLLGAYRLSWVRAARQAMRSHQDLLVYGPPLLVKADKTRFDYNKRLFIASHDLYEAKRNVAVAKFDRKHLIVINGLARRYMLVDTSGDLSL